MLRKNCLPLVLVVFALARTGWAQEADADARREQPFHRTAGQVASSGVVTPTVDMWFYEQEHRRHDDPKLAIRRRAELKAQERRERLASQDWYGISNSRPMVSCTPWWGSYSAYWGSNSYDPQRWRPAVPVLIVARPTGGPY